MDASRGKVDAKEKLTSYDGIGFMLAFGTSINEVLMQSKLLGALGEFYSLTFCQMDVKNSAVIEKYAFIKFGEIKTRDFWRVLNKEGKFSHSSKREYDQVGTMELVQ